MPQHELLACAQCGCFAFSCFEDFAIRANLTKGGALKVISKNSVMRYRGTDKSSPEIAEALGVDLLVSGSVLRVGERVRISVQLVDARADEHLWAESYDRDYDDILSLQSEIARAVATEVTGKLQASDTQRNVVREAYESYLKGRHAIGKFTPESLRHAVVEFQAAIDRDPTYAPAYAGLSRAYLYLGTFGVLAPKDSAPCAKVAALKALELDTDDVEAHTSLSWFTMIYAWDWDKAESGFRHAITLNPGHASTHYYFSLLLGALGRHGEAIAEMRRAHELDPLAPVMSSTLGWCYAWAGLDPVETRGLGPVHPLRFALHLLSHRRGKDRMPPFRIGSSTAGSYVGYAVK